jgi:hypothetical protein
VAPRREYIKLAAGAAGGRILEGHPAVAKAAATSPAFDGRERWKPQPFPLVPGRL